MSAERKRILGMLAEGKISVDECDEMLSALPGETETEPGPTAKKASSGGMNACLITLLIGGVVLVALVILLFVGLFVRDERRIRERGDSVYPQETTRPHTYPLIPEKSKH